jgi:signal transduction histidine kinase
MPGCPFIGDDRGHGCVDLSRRVGVILSDERPVRARPRYAVSDVAGEQRVPVMATDRLSQLADDLLLLARVDSGELPLRRSQIAVDELLESIATRFGRRARDAGRRIEVTAPAGLNVLADRRRLEQGLTNLVDNALRYGAGIIRLEAVADSGRRALRVTDEGPGFPAEFLDRAFERFSRGDGSRAGSGLGLAIVAAIAHAHGGTVTASNRLPGRAQVVVSFPAPRGDSPHDDV